MVSERPLGKSREQVMTELNQIMLKAYNKVIFEGPLGLELFLQDRFSKQLLILLE